MKIISIILLQAIVMNSFAQLKPIGSGVYGMNCLLKKRHNVKVVKLYIAESGKMHGISNATDKPASYFAFKWR